MKNLVAIMMLVAGLFLAAPQGPVDRGLEYKGLERSAACGNGYAFSAPGLAEYCTHGPDAAPPGVDVATAEPRPTSANVADFVCDGDGQSGYRAEGIYAYPAGTASRYSDVVGQLQGYVVDIQQQVIQSSLKNAPGQDPLTYRFVSDACVPTIHEVELSASGDDSFSNTINELKALGFNRNDRNYMIWMDSNLYCGIGTVYGDTRADPAVNANNLNESYSRVDRGCWNYAELHELMHNIGGVQNNSPNSSGGYHCNDDRDTMCYADGGSKSALYIDPNCTDAALESLLDCNGDDYFNPAPAAGSYLDTYWNTANSSYLFTTTAPDPEPDPDPSPSPTPDPDPTPETVVFEGTLNKKTPTIEHTLSWSGGTADLALTGRGNGDYTVTLDGVTTSVFDNTWSQELAAGDYVLTVTGKGKYDLTVTAR